MQQHVASHLEAVAILSLPNLEDDDKDDHNKRANSYSANKNYAESRANDFDGVDPLKFTENDDTIKDTSTSTESEKRTFEMKLEAEAQRFRELSEYSSKARNDYIRRLVTQWRSVEDAEDSMTAKSPSPPLSSRGTELEFAILSLPNLEDDDKDDHNESTNSNPANKNYAESRANDFDGEDPLNFTENDDTIKDTSTSTESEKRTFKMKLHDWKTGRHPPNSNMPISERVVEQKILVAVDFGKYSDARNVTSIQLGSLNIRYYILQYCLGPNRRGKTKHLTSSTTDGQLLFLRLLLKI